MDPNPGKWAMCPISSERFKDPVVTPSGHTYERDQIERWLTTNAVDPQTRVPLSSSQLYPNRALKDAIAEQAGVWELFQDMQREFELRLRHAQTSAAPAASAKPSETSLWAEFRKRLEAQKAEHQSEVAAMKQAHQRQLARVERDLKEAQSKTVDAQEALAATARIIASRALVEEGATRGPRAHSQKKSKKKGKGLEPATLLFLAFVHVENAWRLGREALNEKFLNKYNAFKDRARVPGLPRGAKKMKLRQSFSENLQYLRHFKVIRSIQGDEIVWNQAEKDKAIREGVVPLTDQLRMSHLIP